VDFTEISFWLALITIGVPLLLIRYLCVKANLYSFYVDKIALLVISLFLFINASSSSFIIFAIEIIVNYVAIKRIISFPSQRRSLLGAIVILFDVGILCYFKYFDFLLQNTLLSITPTSLEQYLVRPKAQNIPLGISFYTFQMVAFVADALKNKDSEDFGLADYVNFISFFPKLIAGPIERGHLLLPQIKDFRFRFSVADIDEGLKWFALGLFMKLVLSDNLAQLININEVNNSWGIWLGIFLFGFRIYFDFAGYSFMALGIGRCLGISLTNNFLSPYTGVNVREFWQRWHISLTSWLKDYLYIPLGGSKTAWVSLNILIVFGVSGLWHGAGWNFIIWGLYNGLLLVGYRYLKKYLSLPGGISWALTFFLVMFGWVFFMDTKFHRLTMKLKTIFNPFSYTIDNLLKLINSINSVDLALIVCCLLIAIIILTLEHIGNCYYNNVYKIFHISWVGPILLGLCLLLQSRTSSNFVYFAF
jgi:D-alanyl-lipoteichoic acid acyltransferase DltB (MBOAT superfamily)